MWKLAWMRWGNKMVTTRKMGVIDFGNQHFFKKKIGVIGFVNQHFFSIPDENLFVTRNLIEIISFAGA